MRRREIASRGEINLNPYVDLLFTLLIAFIVAAASIVIGGVDVDLPTGSTQQQNAAKDSAENAIYVTVRRDGSLFIDQEETKFALLAKKLIEISNGDLNLTIFVKADQSLNYGDIMQILARINNAGFSRVVLVTEEK